MDQIKIIYNSSVFVNAGWRSIQVTAIAEKISEKRAKVLEVIDVDGNGNSGYASRTGANRQKYSVASVAKRELDNIKILSKCKTVL